MYHIVLSSCIYTCTHNDTRVGQKETLVHTSQIGEQIQQKLILLSFLIPCIRSQDIKHVSIDDHITFIRLLTECKYWLKIHFLNRIQISQDTVNSLNTNVNNPQQFHKRHVKNTLSICTANMLQWLGVKKKKLKWSFWDLNSQVMSNKICTQRCLKTKQIKRIKRMHRHDRFVALSVHRSVQLD